MTEEQLSRWRVEVVGALTHMAMEVAALRPGGDWSEFKRMRRELVRVLHEDEAIIAGLGSARPENPPT